MIKKKWHELYELALELKKRQPWQILSDADVLAFEMDAPSEFVYVSTMGHFEESYGIAAYFGRDGLQSLDMMMNSMYYRVSSDQIISNMNCTVCQFASRQDVSKENYKLIKELGYSFRGYPNWVYFDEISPGFAPMQPDEYKVERLISLYKKLLVLLNYIDDENISVQDVYESGNMLLFTEVGGTAQIKIVKRHESEDDLPVMQFKDEIILNKLRNRPFIELNVELDIIHAVGQVDTDRGLFLPAIALIADCEGVILAQNVSEPMRDDKNTLLDLLIKFMLENGRVRNIYIESDYVDAIIADLCERIDVEIMMVESLLVIPDFVESFMRL